MQYIILCIILLFQFETLLFLFPFPFLPFSVPYYFILSWSLYFHLISVLKTTILNEGKYQTRESKTGQKALHQISFEQLTINELSTKVLQGQNICCICYFQLQSYPFKTIRVHRFMIIIIVIVIKWQVSNEISATDIERQHILVIIKRFQACYGGNSYSFRCINYI